ncbi:EscU/YscU/HrcU family type III secretion system export apparatus switch protein [Alteribacter keqinensis]|uniref:Type III secretion system protein n=1 Tax=Alteribacter keqinensis TaxID=2483800 RepID=A0A3M7TWE0_9BACI|nr:hypothetical protein EBO34_06645 [Alteribacter keqinensis]
MNENEYIKRKRAIALRYDRESAPVVKAKGRGYVAHNIIRQAIEADLPVLEDQSLVQLLSKLEINEEVPEDLYHAVAEVFAFVYNLDKEYRKKKQETFSCVDPLKKDMLEKNKCPEGGTHNGKESKFS